MAHRDKVHIEVSKDVMDKLEHGQEVDMRLSGTIKALESREVPDIDREKEEGESGPPPMKTSHEVGLEVSKVRVSPKTEFASLVDEDDEEGD